MSARLSAAIREQLTLLPYAHRGLHGGGRIENSRAAFEAAIAEGNGIELDVQASRDGQAMVFHDEDLNRLTGEAGPLAMRSARQLERVRLRGLEETIPTLSEILDLIGTRAPLLIELKSRDREVDALCRSVADSLQGHRGFAAVMSFNPEVGRWFCRHAPEVIRGLVVTERDKKDFKGSIERLFAFRRSRAQFLAYDIRDLPSRFAASARRRGHPVLTWTVRTLADTLLAGEHADQIIYEEE